MSKKTLKPEVVTTKVNPVVSPKLSVSEAESDQNAPESVILVTVESINNLQGKAPYPDILVEVIFANTSVGESQVLETKEDGSALINLELPMTCKPTISKELDQLVRNPFVFCVKEVIPKPVGKEKKKGVVKEDSHRPIGQCNMDLIPLLLGELSIKEVLLLEQNTKPKGQAVVTWPNLPRLTVTLSVDKPLLPEVFRKSSNIYQVTIESMYNIPPRWADQLLYQAATQLPLPAYEMQELRFDYGFRTDEPDVDRTKRWNSLANVEGRSAYTKYRLNDDFSNTDQKIMEDVGKCTMDERPRIEWNATNRCWMSSVVCDGFYTILSKNRCWPVEIMVTPKSPGTSGKLKGKDMPVKAQHLVAYLNITALLYPGVTRARTAVQLQTFCQKDLTTRCGMSKTLFEMAHIEQVKEPSTPRSKKGGDPKAPKVPPVVEPEVSEPYFNDDEQPVYIIVEFELMKPLLAKRTLPVLLEKISSIIPPRPEVPKQVMQAELANQHYVYCIEMLVEVLSNEYKNFFREWEEQHDVNDCELKNDFFFYIHTSGVFQMIKDTLRKKVTILIREKYFDTKRMSNELTMQSLISEVYVYLVDEMHQVLNKLLDSGEYHRCTTQSTDCDQLCLFAEEAAEEGSISRANRFYLQRVSQNKTNPDYWLEYGIFCFGAGFIDKALECMKETIILDRRHKLGLLVYAILLASTNDAENAELFFEALTCFHPRIVEVWVAFHLFYLNTKNLHGADVALQLANKCAVYGRDTILTPCVNGDGLSWESEQYSSDSIFLQSAIVFLRIRAYKFVEMALAQELIYNGSSLPYTYFLSVDHYLEEKFKPAIEHLSDALKEHGKDNCLWSLMGHCYFKLGQKQKAVECYTFVHESINSPQNIHLVALRLAQCYSVDDNHPKALQLFVEATKIFPSPSSWLGIGRSFYKMNDFENAEVALTEANYLDSRCPVTWGYLTLLNLKQDRHPEFLQCYRQALQNKLKDSSLLREIMALQDYGNEITAKFNS